MKVVYILGLEHSGTTLSDYLLSKLPNAIGLGEVAQFFSPVHMQTYMDKWGDNEDVRLCSCFKDWSDCEFWSEIECINGLNSKMEINKKYRLLIDHIKKNYSDEVVVIDSSKHIDNLEMIINHAQEIGLSAADIHIVFTLKDPREFAMSVIRKNKNRSVISVIRAFNWWYSSNKKMYEYCQGKAYSVNIYKGMCGYPLIFLKKIAEKIGKDSSTTSLSNDKNNSHVAMGNKNFVLRNSHHITYDDEWSSVWQIHIVYYFHRQAKRLYNNLCRTNS